MEPKWEDSAALERIRRRIREKGESYRRYNFSEAQHALLRTFFDLAQEYDAMEDFYRVCVVAPREFLGFDSRLYVLDQSRQHLQLVCDSVGGLVRPPRDAAPTLRLTCATYEVEDSCYVPIHRKPPSSEEEKGGRRELTDLVLGMLEVYPAARLTPADRFFLRKYSNRIGYNLHNRFIAQQNIRHLKFINNLVMDIEHNVITPNMYFKHLFNQLRKRIKELEEVKRLFLELKAAAKPEGEAGAACETLTSRLSNLYEELMANHHELQEHHAHYSLFLESLFRRDHFRKGHLVLRPKSCSIEKEIIIPQLEHYVGRLERRGIVIEQPRDMIDEEIPLQVDVGLLSQVYANLFSNAVKYTDEVVDRRGNRKRAMAYGREILRGFFGSGKDGIKFNVFTTGRHLSAEEAGAIYKDGFRGERGKDEPGTGHGLSFVKHVVEIHGGMVGYEPTEEGNNFYFILPLSDGAGEDAARQG
ncbi:MAG: HAMP domain-containing sensor histidine kinase [Thermodesulfobacteriota bacterium]